MQAVISLLVLIYMFIRDIFIFTLYKSNVFLIVELFNIFFFNYSAVLNAAKEFSTAT